MASAQIDDHIGTSHVHGVVVQPPLSIRFGQVRVGGIFREQVVQSGRRGVDVAMVQVVKGLT